MNRLTYKEAYDKIIDAYFKDEIKPYEPMFCFCGNLNDKKTDWADYKSEMAYYTHDEYREMERGLLDTFLVWAGGSRLGKSNGTKVCNYEHYEDALFEGMCNALEVLKEIHRSRGEDVDGELKPFTKRQLQPV